MRRRRPDRANADATPPPAPNHANESIQTDDEDSQHLVRKATSKKYRTRQAEFEQQWVTVQVTCLLDQTKAHLLKDSLQRNIIAKRRFLFPLGLLCMSAGKPL